MSCKSIHEPYQTLYNINKTVTADKEPESTDHHQGTKKKVRKGRLER